MGNFTEIFNARRKESGKHGKIDKVSSKVINNQNDKSNLKVTRTDRFIIDVLGQNKQFSKAAVALNDAEFEAKYKEYIESLKQKSTNLSDEQKENFDEKYNEFINQLDQEDKKSESIDQEDKKSESTDQYETIEELIERAENTETAVQTKESAKEVKQTKTSKKIKK